jgi:methylmalonyl-CoA/ethylmalonyl-CoA epimerase
MAAPLDAAMPALALHHVGIVVADLDAALARYRALGFGDGERFDLVEQGVVAVTFDAGSGYVELIQPTDPESPISRFLAKRGDGTHHVAYGVPDLVAALQGLAAAGVRLIDLAPRQGAHGWRIAFVHPESCAGVLTELVEVQPSPPPTPLSLREGEGGARRQPRRASPPLPVRRREGRGVRVAHHA